MGFLLLKRKNKKTQNAAIVKVAKAGIGYRLNFCVVEAQLFLRGIAPSTHFQEAGCVIPRSIEHRTMADAEAEVLVFEPAETRNTGNIVDTTFTAPNGVAI